MRRSSSVSEPTRILMRCSDPKWIFASLGGRAQIGCSIPAPRGSWGLPDEGFPPLDSHWRIVSLTALTVVQFHAWVCHRIWCQLMVHLSQPVCLDKRFLMHFGLLSTFKWCFSDLKQQNFFRDSVYVWTGRTASFPYKSGFWAPVFFSGCSQKAHHYQ